MRKGSANQSFRFMDQYVITAVKRTSRKEKHRSIHTGYLGFTTPELRSQINAFSSPKLTLSTDAGTTRS